MSSFTFFGILEPQHISDTVVTWPGDDFDAISKFQFAIKGQVGAGLAPVAPFRIVGVEVTREGAAETAYTVLGKLDVAGTGGDYISSRFYGNGSSGVLWFPFTIQPIFKTGDELHIHTFSPGTAFATIYWHPTR